VNTGVAVPGTIFGEDGSFRHVVGVSLFWDTPVGPLQFNVSKALKKETFDKERKFEVTLRIDF
jgi:outer membrane protein insertion porin family